MSLPKLKTLLTARSSLDSLNPRPFAIGFVLCLTVACMAYGLNSVTGVPTMLLALLGGMALNAAAPSRVERAEPGICWCAKSLLRIGVALLGFRIVLADVLSLGWSTALIVIVTLVATLAVGFWIARLTCQDRAIAAISAVSVAICGASAALAASTVVHQRKGLEQDTVSVIVIVSLASTIVMIAYPLLARSLGFDSNETAILLGAAIHDVAQVAGAGLSVSPEVGVQAVTIKMIRVACLLPTIIVVGVMAMGETPVNDKRFRRSLVPGFLIAFLLISLVANSGWLPSAIIELGRQAAGWALTLSVAALGLQTSLCALTKLRVSLVATVSFQTLFQLTVALALISTFH